MGVSGRLSGWQQLALSLSFFHEPNLNAEINNILPKSFGQENSTFFDRLHGRWMERFTARRRHLWVQPRVDIVCSLPTHLLEEGKN